MDRVGRSMVYAKGAPQEGHAEQDETRQGIHLAAEKREEGVVLYKAVNRQSQCSHVDCLTGHRN